MRLFIYLVVLSYWLGIGESTWSGAISHYLGCYPVSSLNKHSIHIQYQLTGNSCFELCDGLGSRFVGISRLKNYCYCDNKTPEVYNDENVNCEPCPDQHTLSCGGDAHASLYELPKQPITAGGFADTVLLAKELDGVEQLKISDGSVTILVKPNHTALMLDYHYKKNLAFAMWDYEIFRFPLNKAHSSPQSIVPTAICKAFTVDWVHDHILWVDCGSSDDIMMADLDGKNPHKLVRLGHYRLWVIDMVVDPYRGLLFWSTHEELMSCELDGRNVKTLLQNLPAEFVLTLVLDMRSERVYFNGIINGSATIFYSDYNGSNYHILHTFTGDLREVWIAGVLHSQLYLVRQVYNHGFYLFRTPTVYNNTLQQQDSFGDEGFQITDTISHMKIVDPQLQSPGRVDACTSRGCSHHCLVQSSIARCRCPLKFSLSSDDKTCEKDWGSSWFYYALGGIACVLSVLLGAGVLMCLCDKLWSKAHPTVVRIADSNIFKRSIIRHRQDNDELI